MAVIYNKIAIIGMGLIGASIARASRRAGLANVMAGYDADPMAMADVAALQLVDEVADSAAAAVAAACPAAALADCEVARAGWAGFAAALPSSTEVGSS